MEKFLTKKYMKYPDPTIPIPANIAKLMTLGFPTKCLVKTARIKSAQHAAMPRRVFLVKDRPARSLIN
jgi:hypothetical protein